MECKLFVLLFLFSLLPQFNICVDQASFYGSSHIYLPFKEAKSSTDVHFKFRTLLPNALILLVAGNIDYCIVRLESGRLKVNINLGAGESELLSQHGKLNDFKWHHVAIVRKEADLMMSIDNTHKVQKHLPGRFFELNIDYGLFIGGRGNFSEIFFGHLDNFRGCLSDLTYNGLLVLEQARLRQMQSVVQRITWNCATEFGASLDDPISFVEDDAFMFITHNLHNEIKVEFDVKTTAPQGTLVYNTGHGNTLDLFLIEIWKGKIRLIIKSETANLEVISDRFMSDGEWHSVYLHVNLVSIELVVDGKMKKEKNSHHFQLSDSSYFGGLETSRRSRAMSKGCQFCDTTFKGCMKNIILSDVKKGLPHAHITEGLLAGCVWQYPCQHNPCKNDGICVQQGLDSFQCRCQEEFCLKLNYTEGYKVFSRNNLATELELLAVEPLEVIEGQSSIITTKNLYMILDYQKYGIDDSGINFYVIERPSHGTVDIRPHKSSFALSDVAKDKVHYVHDGSEYHQDVIFLEIDFSPDHSFILPEYLQGRSKFSLSVNVVPVNDLPILKDTETSVLRIVQGTKTIVSGDLFKVEDPDSSTEQIVFNIIRSEVGHFEHRGEDGTRISSFSLKELDEDRIMFVDHSSTVNDSYISLQISDGIGTSPVYNIRVSIAPQFWRLENNTGLTVLHQTSAVITPLNLSFTSNVLIADHKVQFLVIKKPSYGVIEVEKSVNLWQPSEIFTNADLKQHRVRYRHVTSKPDFDEFQFRITADKSSMYTFRLTFAKCSLSTVNVNPVLLNATWEVSLSPKHLSFETKPIRAAPTSIHYVITAPPQYGFLFLAVTKYKLRSCDMFSQEDVESLNIKYRSFKEPYSFINDSFSFIVLSPGCNNLTYSLNVVIHPSFEVSSKVRYQQRALQVEEGSSGVIDYTYLRLDSNSVTDLLFNITKKAEHGILQINSDSIRNDTDYFLLEELKSQQLYYHHDGGETEKDQFTFMALSMDKENFQYVGDFKIIVVLKNDHSPVRAVDKIFHVVVGGDRLLTKNDLMYTDADINTSPLDIRYTCRESPNGNFYLNNERITEFTQSDLDNNRILFRHKGPEYAKVRLWVTDGHYHTNGVLEIQASAPFIHVDSNKKLIVEQGSMAVITQEHLTHSTNVFSTFFDIVYEIVSKPSFGKIVDTGILKPLKNFTQEDVNLGRISYVNEVANANADEIGLRVRCKDAVNVAQIGVWLLPSSYWEPFKVNNANKLLIEESTSAIVGRNILEISQANVPSSAITYYFNKAPENGYISILTDTKLSQYEPINVLYFTQDLINDNRVLYIQSVANQTKDKAVFNVTNGLIWYNDLVLKIEIIPEHIYLATNNLTVNEGGSATLTTSHIFLLTEFYKNQVKEYTIIRDAEFGCIQIQKKCSKFNSFSHKELMAGVVSYAHDNSENLVDRIQLIGVTNQKRSVPVTLTVNILPVNDQKPKLVNNTQLEMWEGGVEVITNSMLAAVDDDRPGDTLKYEVFNCWWGSLALKSDPSTSVSYFTQELIDKEMIVFHSHNGSEAKCNFNVSDGLHTTKQYTFHVKTKPVSLRLRSKPLHIFPLQRKYVTSSHLLTIASDPSREILYEIVTPPSLGRIMMEGEMGGIFKIAAAFTQNNINNTQVFYEHTHQFSDLYANDSFVFNVKTDLGKILHKQVLKIDISVSSGGLDAYVNVPKISVNEGAVTTIPLNLSGVVHFLENHAGLHSPIIHATASPPQHGQIFLQNDRNISTFTQQQLETGQVRYEHDHSDSFGDNINFSLYLIPGYIVLCNVTVPILVIPINDQPFHLVTPAPSLSVVQGENFIITRSELATEDADTPPSKIKYDIISGPSQGKLLLLPDKVPVTYFTQADVDNELLVYEHNSSVLKDSFHFRVWDEKFRPQFTLFNIMVVPLSVNITPGSPVYLQQGSQVGLLSEKQFFIQTNGDKDKIKYRIINKPKHGDLFVKDAPSTNFTQIDLKNDNVMYLQTDMTTPNDTFKMFGEISSKNTSFGNEIEVMIQVQPLMQIKDFTVGANEYNKITLNVIDATPLAKLTNTNPRYNVLKLPQHTQVRKVIRSSGEKRNVLNTAVNTFTHEEVQSGVVFLAVNDIDVPWNGIQDRLVFLLAASIFQPAVGELKVDIRQSLDNDIHSTLAGPSDPAGHEGGLHFASPNMTRDYFLIVSMVAGVVVLGVAVIVIIKCRSLETDELNKEDQSLQPMPLPRPPDRLMSSPSPLKQHLDDFTPTLSAALPQCKVTPLNRNELDSHACYPYGVEEHSDDWSSCDASDPTCPTKNIMLRRNQYWV